jgi:hypothetical protein
MNKDKWTVNGSDMKPVTLNDALSEMKVKSPRRYKKLMSEIDNRVERAYGQGCSGIQIDVMDIGKVFEHGRRQILTEGLDDTALAKSIREYVETIRRN